MGKRSVINRPAVARLHELLSAAGIPVETVRRRADGEIEIEFGAAATPAQRTQAETLVAGFDPNAPSPDMLEFNQLVQDMTPAGFAALTGVQKLERMRAVLALLLKDV